MQEESGDHFDGDRAKVVWSLAPGFEGERSSPAPRPAEDLSASQVELQLLPDVSAADAANDGNEGPDSRPNESPIPSSRPTQREVPRSFTLSSKMRAPGKKKNAASLRTLAAVSAPFKHADAKSMAALLKGVKSTPKPAQQPLATTVDCQTSVRSPPVGSAARQGLNLAASSTPVAGLQHDPSPHIAPVKSTPRSQLRTLKAPPTGMTMTKLLAKRPLPTASDVPGTPAACAMSDTSFPKAVTPAITPQASLADCATPLDGSKFKAAGIATPPCLSASTPILVPGSSHRNPSRTPASLLQRSAGGKRGHQPGLRKLPGTAVVQTPLQPGSDVLPQCASGTAGDIQRQRTHADLFAGVPKQDKPSSLFTPMAPKPKRHKDKSGGMQQKLEDELESLRYRQEAGLQMTASELEDVPHIRFQTVCEPAFEGQLVKLLCDIENVRLASQDDSKDRQQGVEGHSSGRLPDEPPADRILEEVSQAFVFFDHSAEKHVGLHVGSQFSVLSPWDVVMTPFSDLPVVLAHVTIPQPQP